MVEIITQWPGHAAEEVERLITVPVEVGMNGIPRMTTVRSISLYGLSDVSLHLSGRHGQLFRPPARSSTGWRDLSLPSGVTPSVSPLTSPSGPDLSLRAAKPRPLADGAQDLRGLDRRAANTNPCPAWRTIPASAAAPCSIRCCSIRRRSPASGLSVAQVESRAGRQQQQCRRRLLFAGRPVLLRARPGPHGDAGGHRQRGAGGAQRHAGAGQGRRPGGDRHRPAPGRVRLSRSRTTRWKASS